MLDATKYINRLRIIVKSVDKLERHRHFNYSNFILSRVEDVIKDYDRDFDEAMEKMEIEEMLNMKRGDPYAEGTG
tara:strand:+ start:360 stop:584 length:225 start_codon:yes stop_codon:yes gene_type:complete